MRAHVPVACAVSALLVLTCGRMRSESGEAYDESGAVAMAPVTQDAAMPEPVVPSPPERQVIRNAELALVVLDPPAAAERLVRLADSLGGYASDVRGDRRDATMGFRLVLRVPAARLDDALAAAKALAIRVESEAVQAEDVTDQMVDLDARLTTLEATEAELRTLLAESRSRGSDVEEIMAVYRELTGIRTQIEQIRAQREMLASRVALSTLTVDLLPEAGSGPLVGNRWRPGSTVRAAIRTLVEVLQRLVDVLIYAGILLLPILVILALPLVVVFLLIRRRWRRRAT